MVKGIANLIPTISVAFWAFHVKYSDVLVLTSRSEAGTLGIVRTCLL